MKNKKNDVTVILPIHELTDETKQLTQLAINSVVNQNTKPKKLLIVVTNDELLKELKSFDYGDYKKNVEIVVNNGETDFSSQINYGVSKVATEWVSILEMDDEYSKIWFNNFEEYQNHYSDVGCFLPIIIDVNTQNEFLSFTNEAVWANGFSDEMGLLDNNILLSYQNFNLDGAIFKTSLFEEYGGFKPSIKLTFMYELFLRLTFNDVKMMVIPKLGYKHLNQRENSLFYNYKTEINPIEAKWWLNLAQKEYYFKDDRKITYDSELQ